jgi:sugar lactone lactonase YvrE
MSGRPSVHAFALALLLAVTHLAREDVRAATLAPGDILVADSNAGIIKVDPTSGAQTIVSSGGSFSSPNGMAIAANGDLLIADGGGKIIRVDPASGFQEIVTSGGSLVGPVDVVILPDRNLLVLDFGLLRGEFNTPGKIVLVDLILATQSLFASGGSIIHPRSIAVASNGDVLITDAFFGGVIRIDPVTKTQSTVTSGGRLSSPGGIAIASNGQLFVAEADTGMPAIVQVDPVTGGQTVVSSGGNFHLPDGLTIAPDGSLLVADSFLPGVIRVNVATGTQTVVASGGNFFLPSDVALARCQSQLDCDDHDSCTTDSCNPGQANGDPLGCVHTLPTGGCTDDAGCPPELPNCVNCVCVPLCGNGRLDPGEACDPSVPGIDARCCINQCGLVRTGASCRLAEELGLCHDGSTCDGSGQCQHRPKPADLSCRAPLSLGECDGGDVCDGVSLECPTLHSVAGCDIAVEQRGDRKAAVKCKAPKVSSVADRDTSCAADGTTDDAGAATVVLEPAQAGGVVVINEVNKALKSTQQSNFRRRVLKLGLNAQGRQMLKTNSSGKLLVRVRVVLTNGPHGVKTSFAQLSFRKARRRH